MQGLHAVTVTSQNREPGNEMLESGFSTHASLGSRLTYPALRSNKLHHMAKLEVQKLIEFTVTFSGDYLTPCRHKLGNGLLHRISDPLIAPAREHCRLLGDTEFATYQSTLPSASPSHGSSAQRMREQDCHTVSGYDRSPC